MSRVIKRSFKNDYLANSTDGVRAETVVARQKIRLLQKMVNDLLRELDSLGYLPNQTIEQGVDFYTEVSHFEIEMIKRALSVANGHQSKAAELLNLKSTTLNAMIRRYYIQFSPVAAAAPSDSKKPEPTSQLWNGTSPSSHKTRGHDINRPRKI